MSDTKKKLSDLGEFGLIDLIRNHVDTSKSVIKGIGDDTAVLPYYKDQLLLLTTDMMVEGVHFKTNMGARAIGYKALGCNISDVAAMGGTPTYAVVSLGVPSSLSTKFVKDVYQGIRGLSRKFKVVIIGGDTVKSNKFIINIALLGIVKERQLITRNGARKGDMIFVTGRLGRSLKSGHHLSFLPRIKEAQFLVRYYKPSAMIDISDGLIADLKHVLDESKAGAFLFETAIPRAPKASLREALYDGEDFELLFTVSKKKGKYLTMKKYPKFNFTYIGDIVDKKEQIKLIDPLGRRKRLGVKGYTHF